MLLRLAVWNCNMRLHDKLEGVRLLDPGVLVAPECACPEVLLRRVPRFPATSFVWTGSVATKGLAVFGFGPWRVEADRAHDPRGGTTAAVRVSGPATIRLVAVWEGRGRREPLAAGIARLGRFLSEGPAAIAGDFNGARGSAPPGFRSAYALLHGNEREATLFLRRRTGLRGHRDLVLLDRRLAAGLRAVEIGARGTWTGASDHAPVVATIDTARVC